MFGKRTSRYGECVAWRKSSFSSSGGDCVELANIGAVRDSKNPTGPAIHADLDELLNSIKADGVTR